MIVCARDLLWTLTNVISNANNLFFLKKPAKSMLIIKSNVTITTVRNDIALLQSKDYHSSERAINWNPNDQKQVLSDKFYQEFSRFEPVISKQIWSEDFTTTLQVLRVLWRKSITKPHEHQLTAMKNHASTLNIKHKKALSL